ncbi:hypothetical protein M427DRAFT_37531 [Gonapodya prolifera JEL478]|uniref:Uncharacterized protein n=1 Tax=Gonapodya prolifera (strain JEL478) TaxID=1344416 RepID=A0A139A0E7_GONPJ|nr:hypothetical protein M427DRAFT_37531 [Gonapodya prolifera JEL478]|eukprot:KXS10256.1 hypothetical protein M427DRAFT_37531 [Gonapodya prolifera JEL478]
MAAPPVPSQNPTPAPAPKPAALSQAPITLLNIPGPQQPYPGHAPGAQQWLPFGFPYGAPPFSVFLQYPFPGPPTTPYTQPMSFRKLGKALCKLGTRGQTTASAVEQLMHPNMTWDNFKTAVALSGGNPQQELDTHWAFGSLNLQKALGPRFTPRQVAGAVPTERRPTNANAKWRLWTAVYAHGVLACSTARTAGCKPVGTDGLDKPTTMPCAKYTTTQHPPNIYT